MNRIVLPVTLLLLLSCQKREAVDVWYDTASSILSYGVGRLDDQMEISVHTLERDGPDRGMEELFILTPEDALNEHLGEVLSRHLPGIEGDGFKIIREGRRLYLVGLTDRGCLYGLMDLAEQMAGQQSGQQSGHHPGAGDLAGVRPKAVNPALGFRAIKFNLPWSPYRPGEAAELHYDRCRDLGFWEEFLDMMVKNRFNALTLWNNHPFPYLIRSIKYPAACPFTDAELEEWRGFWKALFRMARERGIETYLVNWNIVVSPEFASAYGAEEYFDRSEQVKDYTRESVTQLINEYEDLTGLGVTLADWMGNWGEEKMTPREREEWIRETFVEGMKAAAREVKFIHRAVLAGDPDEMRRVINTSGLTEKAIVEVKFNWSHGHSTPHLSLTHSDDQGAIARGFWDPVPENYFIAWMIRNEDFFVLRWGDPGFIREHIRTNTHKYVNGYFVGSEGYIPGVDYSHGDTIPPPWKHAFEKQWLFYHLWGRLLYNPAETDQVLALDFERRYPGTDGQAMLRAWSLASRVPLHLATFYKGTWDFTLYSEGFLAPWPSGYDDGKSPFISLGELIRHETLDPGYLSIADYCRMIKAGRIPEASLITPPVLAQRVEDECRQALALLDSIESIGDHAAMSRRETDALSRREASVLRKQDLATSCLESELDDIRTWCSLGFYFADKLRAGVALESFMLSGRREDWQEAVARLEACTGWWEEVVLLTVGRYRPMPYVSMGHPEQRWPGFTRFHWSDFQQDVEADLEWAKGL